MPKYSIVVEYIGTNYSGSQKQPNMVTVQSELEKAIRTLIKGSETNPDEPKIIFSGRTDAGVHSKGQVVHFVSEKSFVASKFLNSLNGLLPSDISVRDLQLVDNDFHAQKSAQWRWYQYKIVNRQQRSVWDGHSLLVRYPLNVQRMNKGLSYLLGRHDFTSFRSQTANPARECIVNKAECKKIEDIIYFDIIANRFLYNMVRTIVGTMLFIEANDLPAETFREILEAKDRTKAAATINADGLTLMHVGYSSFSEENIKQ